MNIKVRHYIVYTVMDEETHSNFVSMHEASAISSLHPHTIRKYVDQGKIKCFKTPSGQRKINRQSLEAYCFNLISPVKVFKDQKTNFLYTRVSSKKQVDDLIRQTQFLRDRDAKYSSYVSITDVASGINFKRKGLQVILDACLSRTVGELVIAHRDRLCRFGYELIETIVEKSGGKITVIDNDSHKTTEQELAEDLLSIVHIYSCKQMGRRSYTNKSSKIPENQVETFSDTEENS